MFLDSLGGTNAPQAKIWTFCCVFGDFFFVFKAFRVNFYRIGFFLYIEFIFSRLIFFLYMKAVILRGALRSPLGIYGIYAGVASVVRACKLSG